MYLRLAVPGGTANDELGAPFVGLIDAIRHIWVHGAEPLGAIATLTALGLAAWMLHLYRLGHPLSWVLVAWLGFAAVMGISVIGMTFGSARSMMPLQLFAIVELSTARAHRPHGSRVRRPETFNPARALAVSRGSTD
jgi:hypothetical protein